MILSRITRATSDASTTSVSSAIGRTKGSAGALRGVTCGLSSRRELSGILRHVPRTQMLTGFPEIVMCPPELEFRPFELTRRHYIGPFETPGTEVAFQWDRLHARKPLVYCALGSYTKLYGDAGETLLRAVAAIPRLRPDLQVVIAAGAFYSALAPLMSDDMHVVQTAPQRSILRRAAVFVTHGGLNSVKEAILEGVPMVAFPLANDQPGTAARMAYHHLGRIGRRRDVSPKGMATLVGSVLQTDSYRCAVRGMRAAIVARMRAGTDVDVLMRSAGWSVGASAAGLNAARDTFRSDAHPAGTALPAGIAARASASRTARRCGDCPVTYTAARSSHFNTSQRTNTSRNSGGSAVSFARTVSSSSRLDARAAGPLESSSHSGWIYGRARRQNSLSTANRYAGVSRSRIGHVTVAHKCTQYDSSQKSGPGCRKNARTCSRQYIGQKNARGPTTWTVSAYSRESRSGSRTECSFQFVPSNDRYSASHRVTKGAAGLARMTALQSPIPSSVPITTSTRQAAL